MSAKPVFKDGRGYWETSFGFYPRSRCPMAIRLPDGQLLDALTGEVAGQTTYEGRGNRPSGVNSLLRGL